MISPTIFVILLLIQTMQHLTISFDNNLPYMWNNDMIRYFSEFISYVEIAEIMKKGNYQLAIILLYIQFSFLVLVLICHIYTFSKPIHRVTAVGTYRFNLNARDTGMLKLTRKIFLFGTSVSTMITTAPFLQISLSMLFCGQGYPFIEDTSVCYKGQHIVHACTAGLCIITLIYLNILSFLFFNDVNFCSKLPFAGFNFWYRLIKFLEMVVTPVISCIDHEVSHLG